MPREIERCPLESCVLLGKSVYPDKTPSQFLSEACQPPKEQDIDQAIKSLKELQALTMTTQAAFKRNKQDRLATDEILKKNRNNTVFSLNPRCQTILDDAVPILEELVPNSSQNCH